MYKMLDILSSIYVLVNAIPDLYWPLFHMYFDEPEEIIGSTFNSNIDYLIFVNVNLGDPNWCFALFLPIW